jgi:hypothetical protein
MKKKIDPVLLGSVAVMTAALLGGMAFFAPVFAQMNGPQYSTPEEHYETQQLNNQGMNGTAQSPAELNGETPSQYQGNGYPQDNPNYPQDNQAYPQDGPSYSGYPQAPDNGAPAPYYGADPNQPAPPSYQQQQYDQQMQQYQDEQQQYQGQRDQYQQQRDRYDRNMLWYDQAQWNFVYPRAYNYDYNAPTLIRLNVVEDPSTTLHGVPIEGPDGVWVGRIRSVEVGPYGGVMRVEVALNRRVSVWVDARNVRFSPDERVAFTNLTRANMWQLPGARVVAAPL